MIETYFTEALKTESNDFQAIKGRLDDDMIRLLHGAMGASTEANEVLDIIKKHLYYGKPLDKEHLIEELGDVIWYLTIIMNVIKTPISDVLTVNQKKLAKRYQDQKFDQESALKRDLAIQVLKESREKGIVIKKVLEAAKIHPTQFYQIVKGEKTATASYHARLQDCLDFIRGHSVDTLIGLDMTDVIKKKFGKTFLVNA